MGVCLWYVSESGILMCRAYVMHVSVWLPSLHVCLEKSSWVFGFVGIPGARGVVNAPVNACVKLCYGKVGQPNLLSSFHLSWFYPLQHLCFPFPASVLSTAELFLDVALYNLPVSSGSSQCDECPYPNPPPKFHKL